MNPIENIQIRFSGTANFKEVYAAADKMNVKLKAMQAELAKLDARKINDLRNNFNNGVAGANAFATEAVKAKSATQVFTEQLVRQDVSLGQLTKSRRIFNEVLKEQYNLQRMTAVQWSKSASGTIAADIMVPKGSSAELDRNTSSWLNNRREMNAARKAMKEAQVGSAQMTEAIARHRMAVDVWKMRVGIANQTLGSFGANMIKWGKNTQWAGRQLMVGFTVPFAAFAAVAGISAKKVDEAMTRILKVYDYSAKAMSDSATRQVEADAIRSNSLNAASDAARKYGTSVEDTLDIEAELAAQGQKGNDLIQNTAAVNRAMLLGELDKQDAIKATTTLQQVYKHSTSELAADFNYMTAMSNATNLSMQDFVTALPKGAGVMKNVGVELRDIGLLMVALKAGGVAAGEGMNALRSGAQRVLQPTPQAEDVWKKALPDAKSIEEIVKVNKGKFIPILKDLGEAMKPLQAYEKQQILTKIFGIQQSNKMFTVMDGLINKTGQMANAYKVFDQNAAADLASANTTLASINESASQKFKVAVATIKAELASLGKSFLPLATTVIGFVAGFFKAFNGLPSWAKNIALIGGVILALAGPLVMMVGLTANMIGNITSLVSWIVSWTAKNRALTTTQMAEKMMAQQTTAMWNNQGMAARALSEQIRLLTLNMEKQIITQQNAALALAGQPLLPMPRASTTPAPQLVNAPLLTPLQQDSAGTQVAGKTGRYLVGPGGTIATPSEKANFNREADAHYAERTAVAQKEAARQAQVVERASAGTNRNWKGVAAGTAAVAVTGGVILSTMDKATGSAKSLVSEMVQALMIASLIGPMLYSGMKKAAVGLAIFDAKAAFSASRLAGVGIAKSLKAAIPFAGTLAQTILKFAGPVGLLATAGFAIYKIHAGMDAARKKQMAINDTAKTWADILGFTYTEQAKISSEAGKNQKAESAKHAFIKNSKDAAEALQNEKDEQKLLNLAIDEGTKVRLHGGTAQQAEQAMRTALAVAGKKPQEIDDMMVNVKLKKVNFQNMDEMIAQQLRLFQEKFNAAADGNISADDWLTRAWESVQGGDNLSSGTEQMLKEQADSFYNTFEGLDAQGQLDFFKKTQDGFTNGYDNLTKTLGAEQTAMLEKNFKINNIDDLIAKITEERNTPQTGRFKNPSVLEQIGVDDQTAQELIRVSKAQETFAKEFAKSKGANEQQLAGIHTLADAYNVYGSATETTADAERKYNEVIGAAEQTGAKFTEQQKLAILNTWRHAAGMVDATTSAQGFGNAMSDVEKSVNAATAATEADTKARQEWADRYMSGLKTAYSGAMDFAAQQAENIRNEQAQAIEAGIEKRAQASADAIDARAEKQDKKFDDRQKALDKAADAREKKANDAYDKKEKGINTKFDKAEDTLETRQTARTKAVQDSYQKRIDAVNTAIKAEQDAEAKRQAIFEAEKTRLQQQADLANKNIDFNVALQSGNFDDAAKIGNDIKAATDAAALDIASQSSQSESDKKVAGLEASIAPIEKERDARLDALKKMDDAEKKALADRKQRALDTLNNAKAKTLAELADKKQREADKLQAEKDRYKKSVEAQKKHIADAATRDKDANTKELARKKTLLDLELQTIRASTPKNKTEYDAQIAQIEAAYKKYGINLQGYGQEWTGIIGAGLTSNIKAAADGLQNDIDWAATAKKVADDFMHGAFNMTMKDFAKWVMTGKPPHGFGDAGKAAKPKAHKGDSLVVQNNNNRLAAQAASRHTGGLIDGSHGSRAGVSRSSSLMPSEQLIVAKKGEFMMRESAVNKFGPGTLAAMNDGKMPAMGGPDFGGAMGFSGMIGGGMFAALDSAMMMGTLIAAKRAADRDAAEFEGSGDGSGAYTGPPLQGFDAFFRAIAGQESGGNYSAVNSSTGALGKYQIMPANVPAWGRQYLGMDITPNQFLNDHELQEKLAHAVLESYYAAHGPRGAAAQWYSGDWRLSEDTRSQNGYPSIKNYVDSVVARMHTFENGTGTATTSATSSALPAGGLDALLKQNANGEMSPGDMGGIGTGDGAEAVRKAASYIGTPYQWGGAAPGGFDCSGLIQYVYRQLGINLGRTTFDQVRNGVEVPLNKLKPGDILFNSSLGHEALYAGNNQIIEAPRTGLNVRKYPLTPGRFSRARRVVNKGGASDGPPVDDSYAQELMNSGGEGALTIGAKSRPLANMAVSSKYGLRENPLTGGNSFHNGIDLEAPVGSAVRAVAGGKVLYAGNKGAYGNYTIIQHANGMVTAYGHQKDLGVKPGQIVGAGQTIGTVGMTGATTGPHLHMQAGMSGKWLDPKSMIPGLAVGGYTLNDGYAMLHKNETVLTADLSDKLNIGIDNLAKGDNTAYTIHMNFDGATFTADVDVERAVSKVLNAQANKMGRGRKVS